MNKTEQKIIDEFNINGLSGQYFHIMLDGKVHQQGMVLGSPHPGTYYVEIFSFLDGVSRTRKLIPVDEMLNWRFYSNNQDMNNYYENDFKKVRDEQQRKMRDEQ